MKKDYLAPSAEVLSLMVESSILTSSYDEKHNTETLGWDEYQEL